MNQRFSIFDVIVVSGIIQGLLYSMILWQNPVKSRVKNTAISLLLVMVLLSCKILLHTLGLWNQPLFRYFPLAIDTLFQPLIYLYALALTGDSERIRQQKTLHWLIPGFFLAHGLLVYFLTVGEPNMALKEAVAKKWHYNSVKRTEDFLAIVSAVGYWIASFLHIRNYRKWLFQNKSATRYPELTWMRNLLTGSGIFIIALFLSSWQANILQTGSPFLYTQLFYIYLTFLIYFFAIYGSQYLWSFPFTEQLSHSGSEPAVTGEQKIPFEKIHEAILEGLEVKKLYLDPELTLKQLAAYTGYPLAQVSATINRTFDQNFRNLINTYRVNEVRRRLSDPAFQHLTLLGIALESGFNSEASFYRIFRKFDGDSPKNYLRSLKGH